MENRNVSQSQLIGFDGSVKKMDLRFWNLDILYPHPKTKESSGTNNWQLNDFYFHHV
jgi:hypothetical protein